MRINWKLGSVLLLLLATAWTLWFTLGDRDPFSTETHEVRSSANPAHSTSSDSLSQKLEDSSSKVRELTLRLSGNLEALKSVPGEKEAHQVIYQTFHWLEEESPEHSASAIVALLATEDDAFTFGRFAPGKDGYLNSYPTFRTALLDILERLDPARAVAAAKGILAASEDSNEWALSLRILARNFSSAEDRAFFRSKVEALLHKNEWLEEPSFAYLHAFDAAVQEGQFQTIGRLGELMRSPPNRAVAHAATLSVDRFFQQHASAGAEFVLEHPEFLSEATGFRASLMARVNPVAPLEMRKAETYLQSEAVSLAEKKTFLQSFPNFNSTYSYNLITGSLLLSRAEMRERSTAAYSQLSNWLRNAQYPELTTEIESAVNRLARTWKLD